MCGCAWVPNFTLCASYANDFMNEFICKSVMDWVPSKTKPFISQNAIQVAVMH